MKIMRRRRKKSLKKLGGKLRKEEKNNRSGCWDEKEVRENMWKRKKKEAEGQENKGRKGDKAYVRTEEIIKEKCT